MQIYRVSTHEVRDLSHYKNKKIKHKKKPYKSKASRFTTVVPQGLEPWTP